MEEGEGRKAEKEEELLVKKTTRAFAGSRDKKGQGRLLTRRDSTRTRMIVCGEREDQREREREKRDREESAMMNARYSLVSM